MTQPATLSMESTAFLRKAYGLARERGDITDAELYAAAKTYGFLSGNQNKTVVETTQFQERTEPQVAYPVPTSQTAPKPISASSPAQQKSVLGAARRCPQENGQRFSGRARDWPGLHPRTVRWGHKDAFTEGRWAWRMWQAARFAQTPLYAATLTPHRTFSEHLAAAPSPADRMASAEQMLYTIETTSFSAWRLEHCPTASFHFEGIVSSHDLEEWQELATRMGGTLNTRLIADEAMFVRQLRYMTKGARHRRDGRDVPLWELAGHSVREFTDEIMMVRAGQSRRPSMIVKQNIPSREDLAALVDTEPFGAALARSTIAERHRVDRERRVARHQVQLAEMAAAVDEWRQRQLEQHERQVWNLRREFRAAHARFTRARKARKAAQCRKVLAAIALTRLTTAPRKGSRPVTAPPRHRNIRRPAGRHSTAYRMANAPPSKRKTDAKAPVCFPQPWLLASSPYTHIVHKYTELVYQHWRVIPSAHHRA